MDYVAFVVAILGCVLMLLGLGAKSKLLKLSNPPSSAARVGLVGFGTLALAGAIVLAVLSRNPPAKTAEPEQNAQAAQGNESSPATLEARVVGPRRPRRPQPSGEAVRPANPDSDGAPVRRCGDSVEREGAGGAVCLPAPQPDSANQSAGNRSSEKR